MQGRARPRSARVYEDWARLLGTDRPPSWLAACSLDAFVEEVSRIFDADAVALRLRAGGNGPGAPAGRGAVHYVCGTYAAYSRAWSP
jgi:hypothetical protein